MERQLVCGPGDLESRPALMAALQLVESQLAQVENEIEQLLDRQAQLHQRKAEITAKLSLQSAPKTDWSTDNFAWSGRLQQALMDTFGLSGFRPLQRDVINAVMHGRDVLCLLPSGGGKSLCYQLPAIMSHGVTIVVSPLLSLITDQVLGLRAVGVSASSLTSLTPKEDVGAVLSALGSAALRLLYVTPERVVKAKRFMAKLEKLHQAGKLALLAVDEAHCCSQWGNDFRPDYKKMGLLKQQFPDVPLLALTATATSQVASDLKSILRIEGCEVFRGSVNRPNLFYDVSRKPASAAEVTAHIIAFIKQHFPGGESGIVYCLTRKECEVLSTELQAGGISAAHYHADMDVIQRQSAHERWSSGHVQVVVATVAFGMGINKPDVRFVLHHSLSKSMENYYQESGRGGRDGLPAYCRLYYRFSDVMRQAALVCTEPGWQAHVGSMMAYAAGAGTCRRAALLQHFGEAATAAPCRGMCDVCAAGGPQAATRRDVSAHARAIVNALQGLPKAEKRATLSQLLDVWRPAGVSARRGGSAGSSSSEDRLSRDDAEEVAGACLQAALTQFDIGFSAYSTTAYLRATSRGVAWAARAAEGGEGAGGMSVVLWTKPAASEPAEAVLSRGLGSSRGAASGKQAEIHRDLEALRQRLAVLHGVYPHSVLSAADLDKLAMQAQETAPTTLAQLAQLLGRAKAEHYGQDILHVLAGNGLPAHLAPQPAAGLADAGDVAADPRPAPGPAHAAAVALGPRQAGVKRELAPPLASKRRRAAAKEVIVLSDSDEGGGDGGDEDFEDDMPLGRRHKR